MHWCSNTKWEHIGKNKNAYLNITIMFQKKNKKTIKNQRTIKYFEKKKKTTTR
jgi:hypothetical protein